MCLGSRSLSANTRMLLCTYLTQASSVICTPAYSQALVYLKETGMISELLNKYKIGGCKHAVGLPLFRSGGARAVVTRI